MALFLSIGEAMVELSQTESGPWTQGFAGDTLNTAWYARRCLGSDWRVSFFTRVGKDSFSRRFMAFLKDQQIETSFIRHDATRNIGLYAIELTDGERSFAYWREQSAARDLANDESLLERAISLADVIFFSGITLAILPAHKRRVLLALIGKARAEGKITAFDPNIRPVLWESAEALREAITAGAACASIALPSFDDEKRIFGDSSVEACAGRWSRAGAGEVVVKNGGGPIMVMSRTSTVSITPTRICPVDSTGAGDAFNGSYLAERMRNCPLIEAVHKAHAISTKVIARRGALVDLN